tara:strand:+ start:67 stop:402 length:336 start_codon:yes stop_codon:yes gene_type:complete
MLSGKVTVRMKAVTWRHAPSQPIFFRDLFMTDDPIEKQLIVAQKGLWDSRTEGIKSMTVSALLEISRSFLCLNITGVHKHSYPDFRAVTRSNNVVIYTNVVQVCKCHVAIF